MTKLTRYERLQELRIFEKTLSKQINDVEVMMDAIDAGRNRLDLGLNDLQYSSEEIKGQIKILKERFQWLTKQQDLLKTKLNDLAKAEK